MQEEKSNRERFEEFHRDNPQVWRLWIRFALDMIRAGHDVLSCQLIVERIRWETDVVTRSDDPFKINNNHRPFYARMWNRMFPHLPQCRTRGLDSV